MKLTETAEIGRLLGRPASEVMAAAGVKLDGVKYLASPTRGYSKGTWNLDGPVTHIQDARLDWAVPILMIST